MKEKKGTLDIRRILPVIRKEFLHIIRDPRSLSIAVLAPVTLLVIYAYTVTFDIKKLDTGIVDRDSTAMSRQYINKFTSSGYFEIHPETANDMKKSVAALRVNKERVIIVIPRDFSRDIKKNRDVNVQVILDGSDANTASIALGYVSIITQTFSRDITLKKAALRGLNQKRIPVIEPVPRVWYNPEMKSVNYVVPGLISIIMMLISATLTSMTIVRERERGSFEQLISTPVKPLELMAGKLAPYILLGFIDVSLIFFVGNLWFKVPFKGDLLTFVFFTILFLFCSMGMGLFFSSIAPNQAVAMMVTFLGTMLPSFLLSGFIFPIDSMPWAIRVFTYLVPARYFLTALRSLFLKTGVGITVLYPEALFLLAFGMLFLGLSARRFKKKIG